jgi:hypothetical protein
MFDYQEVKNESHLALTKKEAKHEFFKPERFEEVYDIISKILL